MDDSVAITKCTLTNISRMKKIYKGLRVPPRPTLPYALYTTWLYRRYPVACHLQVGEVSLVVEESWSEEREAVPAQTQDVQELEVTEHACPKITS